MKYHHQIYLDRLRVHFAYPWTTADDKQVLVQLAALGDSLYSFRDYLIPATHACGPLVEKALRSVLGLRDAYTNGALLLPEVCSILATIVKPQLKAINMSLKGYDGIPLAPYFPPIIDQTNLMEAQDVAENKVRAEEMREMTPVRDIAELDRLTTSRLAAAVKGLRGRRFATILDIGVIPPLYDYEKHIEGVHKVNVDQGGFGYIALYGESLLIVDEEFHQQRREAVAESLAGNDRLKEARAAERQAARMVEELNEDLDDVNARIEQAGKLKNPERRKERMEDLKESHGNLLKRIGAANARVDALHDAYVGLRRQMREAQAATYEETEATTVAAMLQELGSEMVLMSDRPRRLPREFGTRKVSLYWIGREAHLRRLASALPAAQAHGRFVEWDIVGRERA